jgi:8-oxo-dGTP diphosphatase
MTVFLDVAVAGIVVNDNKILIMRRSKAKSHYAGIWDFPCERVKQGSLAENAIRGVMEEAGLDIEVVRQGNPVTLEDGDWRFVVVPFLCKSESRNVRMDSEHDDFRWVSLQEMWECDMIHYADEALRVLGLIR